MTEVPYIETGILLAILDGDDKKAWSLIKQMKTSEIIDLDIYACHLRDLMSIELENRKWNTNIEPKF